MSGLRVLVTHERFLPEFAGGCEYGVYSLARGLESRGVEVRVMTTGDPAQKTYRGLETLRLPMHRYRMNLAASQIAEQAHDVDVIQTANYHAALPSFLAGRRLNKPVVLLVTALCGDAWIAAPSVRRLFDGVELADSFIVDPHKWLFAPYDCCALLYRDPEPARAAHSQGAGYLDQIDREASNPSDLAIHLSRRARGLPFWFSLATHGTDRYVAAIERTLETTRTVAEAIRACDHLDLVCEPELSVLLFERPGWDENAYAVWSNALAKDGVILCVPTKWRDRTVLRLAFVNPDTQSARVIEVLATLR